MPLNSVRADLEHMHMLLRMCNQIIVVVKAFKTCGLSVATDGSEDEEIHCLKKGQPREEAASVIKS